MTINTKETQAKEFLQSINIRTMKKDLAKLREADSLKERGKISKIKMPAAPTPSSIMDKAKTNLPLALNEMGTNGEKNADIGARTDDLPMQAGKIKDESLHMSSQSEISQKHINIKEVMEKHGVRGKNDLERVLQQKIVQERVAQEKIKEYANEEEKQQIFLLESQKVGLKNQANGIIKEDEPSLALEKNKILIEKKDWQKKLGAIIQEEEHNEAEQKTVEEKAKANNIPSEKQKLEKERWVLEEKNQNMEKKRWFIEGELVKLENRIKDLNENYKKSGIVEDSIRAEITKIDDFLRIIYSAIAQKEKAKREESATISIKEGIENHHPHKKHTKEHEDQKHHASSLKNQEEYLKGVSKVAKEKLAKSAGVEQIQRKKFIEDVEKWAEDNKNNDK